MRKLTVLFLTAVLLCALCLPASAADRPVIQKTTQALKVDGVSVTGCEIYNIDGNNYFKLRDVAYLLRSTGSRFSVSWDDKTHTVSVVTGADYAPDGSEMKARNLSKTTIAAAGESRQTILINGAPNSSMKAFLIGDYNFFQLRDLGKALNFDVSYDTGTRTMLVVSRADTSHTPEPAATSARLGLTADAGRAYLDRIIFLGDSTTYGIGAYYNWGYTSLCPPEQIWTPKSGWMSLSQVETAKIYYRETGEELLIKDAAEKVKPDIMIITMGIDSIATETKDSFIRRYTTLVNNIKAASPDTKIILNSIYPVADSYKYQKDINNDKINAANGWIESIAVSTGCRFLYSWEAIAVNGKLPETAHNGDGLHPNGETYTKIVQYIRTHAIG